MNDEQQGTSDPQSPQPSGIQPATAPPTIAAAFEKPESSWPTVVGVIGIVYASMGLLGNVCGIIALAAAPKIIQFLEGTGMSDADIQKMQASLSINAWMFVGSLIGFALVIMLLVGSIKLIKRRQKGAKLCRLWAWISIPWVIVASVINFVVQSPASDSSTAIEKIGVVIGIVFGLLIGFALPVFMTIWFARGKTKSEIATWRS